MLAKAPLGQSLHRKAERESDSRSVRDVLQQFRRVHDPFRRMVPDVYLRANVN